MTATATVTATSALARARVSTRTLDKPVMQREVVSARMRRYRELGSNVLDGGNVNQKAPKRELSHGVISF